MVSVTRKHEPRAMQPLGKNLGGYRGERIDIRTVLGEVESAAKEHGWTSETFHESSPYRWLALHRPPVPPHDQTRCRRIYLSAGMHGDEPAGPLAMRRLLQTNAWPRNLELWLCPCLNPGGFDLNRRENPQGMDLNRQYKGPKAPETAAHISWLEQQPAFDLTLCLHEDWESRGFYLYELNLDRQPSLAEKIVERISQVCPIDRSDIIEGRAANGGIVRPVVDPRVRPDWPEAFYLVTYKTRLSYTLEAPSDFPLSVRMAVLAEGVNTALASMASSPLL